MLYEEFCTGVGMTIDRKCYERIEAVYMAFDRFTSQQEIYDFYNLRDMNGIETLWTQLNQRNQLCEKRTILEDEIAECQLKITENQSKISGATDEIENLEDCFGISDD